MSDNPTVSRPWRRITPFVRDMVYGANDGIVTTFAIVASVIGAGLEARVILIVGFASLFADGTSMAASDYLAERTEQARQGEDGQWRESLGSALATFFAFLLAGSLPLIPYILFPDAPRVFWWAAGATALALVLVGSARTLVTTRSAWRGALEMLLIGGVAVVVAYWVGRYVSELTGGGI